MYLKPTYIDGMVFKTSVLLFQLCVISLYRGPPRGKQGVGRIGENKKGAGRRRKN